MLIDFIVVPHHSWKVLHENNWVPILQPLLPPPSPSSVATSGDIDAISQDVTLAFFLYSGVFLEVSWDPEFIDDIVKR